MFGVSSINHPDLRRISTDYGFEVSIKILLGFAMFALTLFFGFDLTHSEAFAEDVEDVVLGTDPSVPEYGGDSRDAIERRLLSRNPQEPIEVTRYKAEDLLRYKVSICRIMAQWHHEGDWEARGARALDIDNPRRHGTGEPTVLSLANILKDLEETGPLSDSFSFLKDKVRHRLP